MGRAPSSWSPTGLFEIHPSLLANLAEVHVQTGPLQSTAGTVVAEALSPDLTCKVALTIRVSCKEDLGAEHGRRNLAERLHGMPHFEDTAWLVVLPDQGESGSVHFDHVTPGWKVKSSSRSQSLVMKLARRKADINFSNGLARSRQPGPGLIHAPRASHTSPTSK